MLLNISQIGQIALPVRDVDRSEAFYEQALGLRKLFRFGDLSFFDCAGVRLLIDKAHDPADFKPQGLHLFPLRRHRAGGDRARAARRRLHLRSAPDRQDDDHDLWMAFFTDPDGHTLALMQEAPKGYAPPRLAL
jgi:methylmalonyl-CoA/ethylmalonyl-CoA epimerase